MIEELRQQYFSFLVDAGFIQATEAEKRELISTKYGKSRTRFVRVPLELDTYSRDPKAVMACLAASMYPKLLIVDPHNGQMRTLSNSAPAAIHPSSVNFTPGRRIDFGDAKYIAYFTAMHTKKLCEHPLPFFPARARRADWSGVLSRRRLGIGSRRRACHLPPMWEQRRLPGPPSSPSPYLTPQLTEAATQHAAHSLSIDRKIKTQLESKTIIAMKILRHRFNQLFSAKMRNPAVTTEQQQHWLDLVIEALVTKREVEERREEKEVGKKVTLSIHRNA